MLSVNTQFHARNFSSVLKWFYIPFWCPCSESAVCKIANNSFLILSLCLYSVRSVCAGSTVCVWGFWKTASLITTYVTSAETLQVTILCDNTVNKGLAGFCSFIFNRLFKCKLSLCTVNIKLKLLQIC